MTCDVNSASSGVNLGRIVCWKNVQGQKEKNCKLLGIKFYEVYIHMIYSMYIFRLG